MSVAPKLVADTDIGEGSIVVPKQFSSLYPLLRADLLKDWIFQLEKLYHAARADMRSEFKAARAKRTKP